MKFIKLNDNATIPTRATRGSAGYDLYALEGGSIGAGESVTIPTGITVEGMPDNVAGTIWPRSGLARKQKLDRMAGLIDSDYTRDIGVVLINHSNVPFTWSAGTRIGQIVFGPVLTVSNDVVVEEERTGGFGSTGK